MFSTFAQQINTRLNSLAEQELFVTLAQAEATKKRAEKAAERQRLMEVLHSKKDQELQGLSVEEIERRLSQLE